MGNFSSAPVDSEMIEGVPTVRNTAPLAERLRDRIKCDGPVSFRDWMAAALYDEREGYYCRRDFVRWGREGDYRTSPETSPLFAATFARYFAALHEEQGAPREWTIIEAGGGAGHFAYEVLTVLRRDHPAVFSATLYVIDEASAATREQSQARLQFFSEHVRFSRLGELSAPVPHAIIFSNELLDAFPVHRAVVREGKLLELCVGLDDAGAFMWVECAPTTPRLVAYLGAADVTLEEGQIIEINLEAEDWIARAAASMQRGYLVTVDYGAEAADLYDASHRRAGTLRGFSGHRFVDDVLARLGDHDLTTTVNWSAIKSAGERAGMQTVLFARQDEFLLRVGALDQLERMTARAQSEAEVAILRLGAREMILPGGMSERFQVLVQKKINGE